MSYSLIVTEKGGTPKRLEFDKDEVTIGRVPGNDVILPKGNVSKRHSRVVRQDGRFFVVDLKSTNGTYLNGRRITTPSVIRPGDKIYVGDFVVILDNGESDLSGVDPGAMDDLVSEDAPPPTSEPALSQPRSEASMVDPLPLDEEPPESAPPPPRTIGGPPSIGGARPGPPQIRETLGSGPPMLAPAVHPTIPGGIPTANRPTSPPPRIGLPGGSPTQPSVPAISGPGRPRTGGTMGTSPPPIGAPPGPIGAPPGPIGAPPGPIGAPPGPIGGIAPIGASARGGAAPVIPPIAPIGGGRPAIRETPSSPEPRRPAYDVAEDSGDDGPVTPPPRMAPSAPVAPPMSAAAAAAMEATPPPGPAPMAPPMAPMPPIAPARPAVAAYTPAVPMSAPVIAHAPMPVASLPEGALPREYMAVLAEVVQDARSTLGAATLDRPIDSAGRQKVRSTVEPLARRREPVPGGVGADRLARDAAAELAGGGAFETALDDATVVSVVADPSGAVWISRGGAMAPGGLAFSSSSALLACCDRLFAGVGVARERAAGITEALLADGSKLSVSVSAGGAVTAALDRGRGRPASFDELAATGVLNGQAAAMLGHAIVARRNIIVSGPRGSGRSTLLTALVGALGGVERCALVEERPELARAFPDLPAVSSGGDGRKAVALAQRFGAQRLVVGELSASVAQALASSLVTGAEGMFVAVEGASASGALQRFASLASGGDSGLTRDDVLARFAATRPLVVQLARLADGSVRVTAIGEARAADASGGVHVDEAFSLRLDRANARGRVEAQLVATGLVPAFVEGL